MPELNLNFAPLPPWLTKNEGKPGFLEAKASGQRDRQLGMQEQELESRLISAQQDQQMNELKLAENRRLRDETLEAELAVQQKAPVIAGLMRAGKTEEALQEWMALGVENAKVRAVKSYGTMSDDLRFSLQVKENARLRAEMERGRNSRAEDSNDLRWDIAEAEREVANDPTSLVAQQRLTRMLLQRENLRISGERLELAQRGPGLRAHTELATTLRQEMRAIDASDIPAGQKESKKALLLRRLDESRKKVLGDLEMESVETDSMQQALEKVEKDIADLRVDVAKNPKQGSLDFGQDNRLLKIQTLEAQRDGLRNALPKPGAAASPAAPSSTPPAPPPASRVVGQIYQTPKGPLKWTGTGWVTP